MLQHFLRAAVFQVECDAAVAGNGEAQAVALGKQVVVSGVHPAPADRIPVSAGKSGLGRIKIVQAKGGIRWFLPEGNGREIAQADVHGIGSRVAAIAQREHNQRIPVKAQRKGIAHNTKGTFAQQSASRIAPFCPIARWQSILKARRDHHPGLRTNEGIARESVPQDLRSVAHIHPYVGRIGPATAG